MRSVSRRAILAAALVFAVVQPVEAQVADQLWQQFGDTTLQRLVHSALHQNREVRAVEAAVAAARAARTESVLQMAPSLTSSVGFSRQRLPGAPGTGVPGAGGPASDFTVWEGGLLLSWEVDLFGRLRGVHEGRAALLAAAEEDVRALQVLLAAEVAHTWLELRGTQERLEIARRNAENQRRTLQLTEDRLTAGQGSALDTERAQAQLSSTLAALPDLDLAAARHRHHLAVLLGQPVGALALGDYSGGVALPDTVISNDRDVWASQRPDVVAALAQREAYDELHRSARASYMPRLTIAASGGYAAPSLEALGGTGTPRYAVGPMVSWPLLDVGRVKTRVDAARAERNAAMARYEHALLQAQAGIASALAGYSMARERLRHLEQAATASERATELARLRFTEGGSDFLEVLDAERRLLEAEDRLAAGRAATAAALVAVWRETGGRMEVR